jgi:hypothetical protein
MDKWLDLLTELSATSGRVVPMLPTFEAIWAEASALLHFAPERGPAAEDAGKLNKLVQYQRLLFPPTVMLVFETARSPSQSQHWMTSLIDA